MLNLKIICSSKQLIHEVTQHRRDYHGFYLQLDITLIAVSAFEDVANIEERIESTLSTTSSPPTAEISCFHINLQSRILPLYQRSGHRLVQLASENQQLVLQ